MSWANAWTTSARMREALLLSCCVCQAARGDDLRHLMRCPDFERVFDGALPPAWRLPSGRPPGEKPFLLPPVADAAHLAWLATASLAFLTFKAERSSVLLAAAFASRELRIAANAPGTSRPSPHPRPRATAPPVLDAENLGLAPLHPPPPPPPSSYRYSEASPLALPLRARCGRAAPRAAPAAAAATAGSDAVASAVRPALPLGLAASSGSVDAVPLALKAGPAVRAG